MTETQRSLKSDRWLSSKEVKETLKISDCHLMHLRLAGKLICKKEGNRFFYLIPIQAAN